jgi:fatty acid desaturase
MMAIQKDDGSFPLDEARLLVRDLMKPIPSIYWTDFLFHITLGWVAFYVAVVNPWNSPLGLFAFFIAALALYRSVIFTHELAHRKKGTFIQFRFFWNLLCGFPLLLPSFTYHGVHNDHHVRDIYGTDEDGEYLPFGAQSPARIITYLTLIFILPFIFIFRFVVLAPFALFIPRVRQFAWEQFSSLTIDLNYRRPPYARRDDTTSRAQELATTIYAWTAIALVYNGVWPLKVFVLWYSLMVLAFLLNSLRTLAAHAYRNPGDQKMTVAEQFLDSVDVPGGALTALWAPVALRYHATHHLFPNMPYHSLGPAYRRLKAELGDNRLFLKSTRSSLFDALHRLWKDAAASQQRPVENALFPSRK